MVRRSILFGAAASLALIAGARPAAAGAIQFATGDVEKDMPSDAQGVLTVDEQRVAPADLGPRLAAIAASSRVPGGPRVFLRADRALDYGRVMAVMGEINAAGLRKVALVSTQGAER